MEFNSPCGERRNDEQLTVEPSGYVGFGGRRANGGMGRF